MKTHDDITERNCHKTTTHDPHRWKSYIIESNPKGDNAQCDGSGKPPPIHSTTWNTTKKDYSEDPENFPASNPITVTQARKIAYDMHAKQKDKAGEPYRLHLNAVEKGVTVLGGSDEERIAALFHDAVEDHHTTYALLRKIHVTEDTITMIEAVSKRTSEQQEKYLERIIEAGHGACRVKVADLMHNLRHDRVQKLLDDPAKKASAERMAKKYKPALAALMLELGLIVDEDTQKKLATKPKGTATGSYYGSHGGSYSGNKSTGGKKSTGAMWQITSLFKGDWPSQWPAPILERVSSGSVVKFVLADGSLLEEKKFDSQGKERRLWTYTKQEWAEDVSLKFSDRDGKEYTAPQKWDFEDVILGRSIDQWENDPDYQWDPKN